MATHDYYLENQTGAEFRADLNDVLQAVLTLNSSATEPTTTAAYMLWLDTANGVLKIRNGADDAWVILPLSISADNTVDIDGGTIDGISQLTLGSSTSVNSILDEDNLNSDSPTALATQQSIKAYVDSQVTAQDLDFQGDSGGVLSIDLDSEIFTLNGGTGIDTVGSENTVQFNIDSTVVTLVGVQVLTNKSIDADDNTITNLEVDNLKAGVLDTDLDAVSASDDTLASAKAIKTYVDANITAQDLDVSDGTTSIAIDLDSETLSLLGGTGVSSTASGNGVTFDIGQPVGTTDNVSFGVVTANLTGQVSDISNHSTSNLSEGTNLYYTEARFDTRLATKDTDDLTEGLNLYYTEARFDTRLATKDTDDLTEGTNLYYTQARFDSALTAKSTSDLSEGANLYYTNERVDDQVSALIQSGTGISWSYDDVLATLTPTISLSPFSTTNLSEGTNLYYTTARFDSAFAGKDTGGLTEGSNLYYTSARFDSAFTGKSTSDLSEGTNLYYTTARWDSKLATADTDDLSEGTTNLYYTDTRANSAIDVRVNKAFVDALDIQAASVDANSVALGTDTTGNYVATIAGTSNQIEISGSGSETSAVTVSLPNDVSVANNLTVAGNLTVNGTLTSLDTTNLAIEDNLFELNAGLTGTPVNDSGMLINRGNQDNGVFIWDESVDKFTLGLTTADGTATGNITLSALGTLVANIEGNITGDVTGTVSDISNHDTGDLTEGTNLYYTDVRSRAAISASGDISYNSSTGVISFTQTTAPVTSVNGLTGVVVLTTANISENTNLYYTDARARAAISEGSTQLSYDSGTGVLTYTQGNTDTVAEGTTNLYYTQARFDSAFTAKDTDDLGEGAGNLYYTQARFNSAFTAKSTSDLSEGTNLYYTDARFNSAFTAKSTSDLSEGTNLYYTDARFNSAFTAKSTSDLSEGTNLYYTDARANSAIDARVTQSFVDALNVTAAGVQANSVALGTDTTGDYVSSLVAGTGVTLTNNSGETATPTVAIGQAVAATDDVTFATVTAADFIGDLNGAVRFAAKADVALTKGQVVYISGVSGEVATVGLADADNAATMPAFGLVFADANANASVDIVTFGSLLGLDTSGFSVGDIIYVSTTAGALTATPPTGESSQIQNIGKVQRSHAAAGIIKVGGAGRSNATPNLNSGKVFLGNGSNQSVSTTLDTSVVPENTNLYYTDARVNSHLSGSTGVTYNDGAISIGQAVATSDSPTFANMTLSGTDSIKISSGTTAQRNGTPTAGMFRYNTTTGEFEGYTDEWGAIGGGGGSFTTDIFAGDGADTTFTVSSSVSNENNLMVFIDGVFQAQDSYSVSGTTLTFSTAPANGRVITVYHAKAVSIGTPSDNSVDTVQLVDGAVTSAKLDTNIAIAGTLGVTGAITANGGIALGDGDVATFNSNLNIFSSGTSSYIEEAGAGDLYLKASSLYITDRDNNQFMTLIDNGTGGTVSLMHNTATKLATTSTGIDVTGDITASQSMKIGTGGTYAAGSIYSDAAWGMIFRAKQASPALANFRWADSSDAELMRIDSSGNLLVGTSSNPSSRNMILVGSLELNNGANTNRIILGAVIDAEGFNTANTAAYFGKNTSTNRSINAGGTINASGADYAEYMKKADSCGTIAKGDVCGVDSTGKLTDVFADAISFVIKSTDPSYVGGDTWGDVDLGLTEEQTETERQKYDRIAFSGQVPVNITGSFNVGDYVYPQVNGTAIECVAKSSPTFEEYQLCVGKIWATQDDGRPFVAVKIG